MHGLVNFNCKSSIHTGYNLIDISPSESYKGRWSDGRLTSVIAGVWGQNQPNPESGKCTYVEASDTDKLWYTADCERIMPFVCEMNPCPQGSLYGYIEHDRKIRSYMYIKHSDVDHD